MNSLKLPPPITAAAVEDEWIELRRTIILRDRYPVRAGAGCTIEVRSRTPEEQLILSDGLRLNPWAPMILPTGAVAFTTEAERDAVLAKLTQEGALT